MAYSAAMFTVTLGPSPQLQSAPGSDRELDAPGPAEATSTCASRVNPLSAGPFPGEPAQYRAKDPHQSPRCRSLTSQWRRSGSRVCVGSRHIPNLAPADPSATRRGVGRALDHGGNAAYDPEQPNRQMATTHPTTNTRPGLIDLTRTQSISKRRLHRCGPQ